MQTNPADLMRADQLRSACQSRLSQIESLISEAESVLKAEPSNPEALNLLKILEQMVADSAIESAVTKLSTKQMEAMEAWESRDYDMIGCCGTNRSGKSYVASVIYSRYLRDEAPKGSEHLLVTTDQRLSAKNQQGMLWDLVPHHLFDTPYTGKKNGFGSKNPMVRIDPNGRDVTVHIMTQSEFDNNANSFEGLSLTTAWVDESISHELFSAVKTRLTLSDDGRMLVSSIPNSDWVWEVIYQAKPDDRVWFKLFEPFDNPTMTPKKWERLQRSVPAHEREVRLEGMPAIAGARVYTEFHPSRHVIEHREVPRDVVWYGALDVGADHPTVFLLLAVDKQGYVYVYDEYVSRNKSPEEDIPGIKALIGNRTLMDPIFIDPSAYNLTKANRLSVAQQYIQHGLPVQRARRTARDGERAQVSIIKDLLRHDEIFICESCRELIREFMVWKYRRDQQNKPLAVKGASPYEDKNNDALDALRYGVCSYDLRFERQKLEVIMEI